LRVSSFTFQIRPSGLKINFLLKHSGVDLLVFSQRSPLPHFHSFGINEAIWLQIQASV
jgi:hypothetical protein